MVQRICFEVTVQHILMESFFVKIFFRYNFISRELLLQILSDRIETWRTVRTWGGPGHTILSPSTPEFDRAIIILYLVYHLEFHPMRLKLNGQLDRLWGVQRIRTRSKSTSNFIESLLVKDSSVMTSFPANSSYSFHRIGWKLGRQLDYELVQFIVFQGYRTSKFCGHCALKHCSDTTLFLANNTYMYSLHWTISRLQYTEFWYSY